MDRSRWAVVAAAGALVAAAAAVTYAARTAKTVPVVEVVRARRFELVGNDGRVVASLSTTQGANPVLQLRDRKGTVRAVLALSRDGMAYLEMNDDHARPQVALSQGQQFMQQSHSGAELSLGRGRIRVGFDEDGGAGIGLHDREGRPRAVLGSMGIESPTTGTVEERAESSLVLFDADDRVLWKAP